MIKEEIIQHAGVKGMRWGARRKNVKKTDGTISIHENKKSIIAKAIGKINSRSKNEQKKTGMYTIKDSNNKKVGSLTTYMVNPKTKNIVWVDVKKSQRGNGYAQSIIKKVIQDSKKSNLDKITLEVPGISPDALHIYEKAGFKKIGTTKGSNKNDGWGGLTDMELKMKHTSILSDSIIQHAGIKGMRWGTRNKGVRTTHRERRYSRALKAIDTINSTGVNAPSKRAKAKAYKKVAKYRNMLDSNTLTKVQARGNLEGNISKLATTSGSSNYRKNVKKMLDATSTGIGKDGTHKKIRKAAMAASVLMSAPEDNVILHYGVKGMKHGERKQYKKLIKKAGNKLDKADYYRDMGNVIASKKYRSQANDYIKRASATGVKSYKTKKRDIATNTSKLIGGTVAGAVIGGAGVGTISKTVSRYRDNKIASKINDPRLLGNHPMRDVTPGNRSKILKNIKLPRSHTSIQPGFDTGAATAGGAYGLNIAVSSVLKQKNRNKAAAMANKYLTK